MRKASDEFLQWALSWLLHVKHPDPSALRPQVSLALRSNNMKTRNGIARKRLFALGGHHYEIVLYRQMDDTALAEVLAHEVTHITQYETGRLSHTDGGWVWLGEFFDKDTPYRERPWEIEAFQSEYLGHEVLRARALMESALRSDTFIWYRNA